MAGRDFPICENQVLDYNEEGEYKLDSFSVPSVYDVYCFDCQYEFLD